MTEYAHEIGMAIDQYQHTCIGFTSQPAHVEQAGTCRSHSKTHRFLFQNERGRKAMVNHFQGGMIAEAQNLIPFNDLIVVSHILQ